MKRLQIAFWYAAFAALAIAVNIGIQRLALSFWAGPLSLYGAILLGTAAGLITKYVLDKRYIFAYRPVSLRQDAGTFFRYVLMSGITTAVFWSVELSFNSLFSLPSAKYIGAAIGLTIGYSSKYLLDKRFVFPAGPVNSSKSEPLQVSAKLTDIASSLWNLAKRYGHCFFFVIPCLFYFYTACRTPGWADATMIASNVVSLELGSWVNTHNLFHLLGFLWLKMFHPTNIHYFLVLLSALFGALTVHFVYLTGRELTSRSLGPAIGAVALMVSHSLWWHSTMLEVYTLNMALLALMLYCVVRYDKTQRILYLCFAALFFGLSCSNHVLMGLYIFAFLLVAVLLLVHRKTITVRHLCLLLGCFLLGFQLYIYVFVRDVLEILPRHTARGGALEAIWISFREVLHRATGGGFKRYMFTKNLPAERLLFYRFSYVFWFAYNYASPALLMGFWGFYRFWKKRDFRISWWFFVAGLAAQVAWSANYFIWDMYAFSLPVYVMFSIPVILAVNHLLERKGRVRIVALALSITVFAPVLLYQQVPQWYRQGGFFRWFYSGYPETQWVKHTWEPVEYFSNPNKRGYDKVERYVEKLYSILPQGAHFLNSDCRADYPLRYYYRDVRQLRTDINHHDLFAPFLTDGQARSVARQLKNHLDGGSHVYTASVSFPERAVLDQLYCLCKPGADPADVASIPESEYLSSFPGVVFEKIMLFEEEEIWIYEMRPSIPKPAGVNGYPVQGESYAGISDKSGG